MTTVNDILRFLEKLAPPELKMEWDNVGLLCGDRAAEVTRVLVALDPFEHVCREAVQRGAQLLVTHHPLIFRPLKSVTQDNAVGRSILLLSRNGISAVNAHTNLDIACGGVNDVLARTIGLRDIRPIGAENLLRAGVCAPQELPAFLAQVKTALGCAGLRYVDAGKPVRHVAVGGGSCADEMDEALRAGCDTFVTADVKYNQFWDAQALGLNLIDAGHFATENPVVAALAEQLAAQFPEITVMQSENHRDCMKFG